MSAVAVFAHQLSTFCNDFLDGNQRLRHPLRATRTSRPSRTLNFSGEPKHPETTKPAEEAGHEVPAEAGETLMIWTITSFPELRPSVKRKRLFSLTGGFVPISGPSAAGCNPKGAAKCAALPNAYPPCPASPGRRPMPRGRCGQTAPPRKSNFSDAEEGRDAALAPRARLRPQTRTQGLPRRRRGPHRAAGACTR